MGMLYENYRSPTRKPYDLIYENYMIPMRTMGFLRYGCFPAAAPKAAVQVEVASCEP